jgi:hypothetical protein
MVYAIQEPQTDQDPQEMGDNDIEVRQQNKDVDRTDDQLGVCDRYPRWLRDGLRDEQRDTESGADDRQRQAQRVAKIDR